MARKFGTSGGNVHVQGFRAGGYVDRAHVYVGGYDEDGDVFEMTVTPEQANTLGEYLRQEAEFAQSARNEEESK
jgi:hypothetical protein